MNKLVKEINDLPHETDSYYGRIYDYKQVEEKIHYHTRQGHISIDNFHLLFDRISKLKNPNLAPFA